MRVIVTLRMLREGMLRCLAEKPLSKITVSDLCRESGVNRTTFYNHYDSPEMILKEIVQEYAKALMDTYRSGLDSKNQSDTAALTACFAYLLSKREELLMLFSDNAEHYLASAAMEIISQEVSQNADLNLKKTSPRYADEAECLLCTAMSASALFGFIQIWITQDINKTPAELVKILKKSNPNNAFFIL